MNEYEGPEWAMKILAKYSLLAVHVGEDHFEIHARIGEGSKPLFSGWLYSSELPTFLMGYESAALHVLSE